MAKFFVHHPEWKSTKPVTKNFEWKWYFAFHQVGDESVASQSAAYRAGLNQRQDFTRKLGYILPAVGAQVLLHRLAESDLTAQLAYEDSIANFHTRLRKFFYPYLFDEQSFYSADFGKLPAYLVAPTNRRAAPDLLAILAIVGALVAALGLIRVRRVSC